MKLSHAKFCWFPRILCILGILFISLFATDSFNHELSLWNQVLGFLMHLIPSFVLFALLILSWKRELLGGIIFLIIGIVFSPVVYISNHNRNHDVLMSLGIICVITLPFAVVGVLFIRSYYLGKKELK